MLILSRPEGGKLLIGPSVIVTVVEIGPGRRVRLGIDAPRDTLILRGEMSARPDGSVGPATPSRSRTEAAELLGDCLAEIARGMTDQESRDSALLRRVRAALAKYRAEGATP